jgi:N-hydroxyarylamine O-acetyltransferase
VRLRRGGFCYELNRLFAALLRALGFDVAMLSAGVANGGGEFGPEFDHMALLVALSERWLADVGFGDSFREQFGIMAPGKKASDAIERRRAEQADEEDAVST